MSQLGGEESGNVASTADNRGGVSKERREGRQKRNDAVRKRASRERTIPSSISSEIEVALR